MFPVGGLFSPVIADAQHLGRVSELWLDPQNPFREDTVQALQVSTGLNRRQIELALANAFGELTEEKIDAFASAEVSVRPPTREMTILHILPANAFTAWLTGAAICLLLGHRIRLKPSSREPVFARAWKKSMESVDSSLAQRVEILSWDQSALNPNDAVVAYGADETLREIRSKFPLGTQIAGYGHKLSVGIIFQEAWGEKSGEDLLERVKRDAEPFRLQGCLSPQILYVQHPGKTRWPALETSVAVPPKIQPFNQWDDLRPILAKFVPHLSCIGYAGSIERGTFLENERGNLSVSRVCPLGEMQRPTLSWRNGGFSLVEWLSKCC